MCPNIPERGENDFAQDRYMDSYIKLYPPINSVQKHFLSNFGVTKPHAGCTCGGKVVFNLCYSL